MTSIERFRLSKDGHWVLEEDWQLRPDKERFTIQAVSAQPTCIVGWLRDQRDDFEGPQTLDALFLSGALDPGVGKHGATYSPLVAGVTSGEALIVKWRDAYAAFKGAFDTPVARRKLGADEYAQDAIRRLREFDELQAAQPAGVRGGEAQWWTTKEGYQPISNDCKQEADKEGQSTLSHYDVPLYTAPPQQHRAGPAEAGPVALPYEVLYEIGQVVGLSSAKVQEVAAHLQAKASTTSLQQPQDILRDNKEDYQVMLSAYNLCPHGLSHLDKMRWMADYFRKHSKPEEVVAWLYVCKKPGTLMTYASVDENDTNHWPINQWKSIEKFPLVKGRT